jgi:acetoin utilization deacetylase AcuC-like enzyme
MIIYSEQAENLFDYGILIPIDSAREDSILAALKKNGALFPQKTLEDAASLLGLDADSLITREDVERVHDRAYVSRIFDEAPGGGFLKTVLAAFELINADGSYHRYAPERAVRPLSDLRPSLLLHTIGTYLSLRIALEGKGAPFPNFCFSLKGGCHHPRYDAPSGFGILNDPVIAVRKIMAEGRASFVWIIDVDAHKGDGTAELVRLSRARGETYAEKNPQILTLSAHMARGWPLDEESLAKAVPGRAPLAESDIDIPIESGEENEYVPRLERALKKMEDVSSAGQSEPRLPDLALVIAGDDVYEKDGLASTAPIALSLEQIVERDKLIFSFLRERGIPAGWVAAGGYGPAAWEPAAAFLNALSLGQC